jgi:uncharacterized protein
MDWIVNVCVQISMLPFAVNFISIGLVSGFTIGLLGIGAGVIMIPLLIQSGLSIQQAVAIGLVLQAVPQSLPGVVMHYRNKTLPIKESVFVIIGSVIGIIIGTYVLTKRWIPDKYLYGTLCILMVFIACHIWYKYVL